MVLTIILFQGLIFAGLIFVLRHFMKGHVSGAVGHLQKLNEEMLKQQAELKARMTESEREYQTKMATAQQELSQSQSKARDEAIKTVEEARARALTEREKIIQEAVQTRDKMRNEIMSEMEQKAIGYSKDMISELFTGEIGKMIHAVLVKETTDGLKEVETGQFRVEEAVASLKAAYPLTDAERQAIQKVLKEKLKPELANFCPDCQDRYERNVLRILDCKNERCKYIVKKTAFGRDWLTEDSRNYYEAVKSALRELNVVFEEDQGLVRGLDYYTHTVFEISDSSLGSQDALGAGGRYNNLVSELGGSQVDAVGFALGMERIILAQQGKFQSPAAALDIFVIAMDEKYMKNAVGLVNQIRQSGLSADMSFQGGSMKSQMRSANKLNARYVMILGEDEIKNSEIALKNMSNGTQEKVPQLRVKDILIKLK